MSLTELSKSRTTSISATGLIIIALGMAGFKSYDSVEKGTPGVINKFQKIYRVVDSDLSIHWPSQSFTKMNLQSHTVATPLDVYSRDSHVLTKRNLHLNLKEKKFRSNKIHPCFFEKPESSEFPVISFSSSALLGLRIF